jgi:phospholipid/cholesterol/gamma-HCH transport system substrate-binding protein
MLGLRWVRARLASRWVRIGLICAVVVALAAYGMVRVLSGGQVTASAVFPEAKNLYPGDSVEILGVKVGEVDSVTTQRDGVRVTFHYGSQYKVPANAQAVIVAPELVSDRYVELTPAYASGPVLTAGTTIPESRTVIPVEWNQTVQELNQLVAALGPNGANKNGALSKLLGTTSEYQGQGQLFHNTMQQVAAATQTLNGGSQDLFANVRNLETFTSALSASDQEITQFIDRLNTVSGVLDDNKTELTAAIEELDETAPVVTQFINQNKAAITSATANSAQVARLLSSEQTALENALRVAPDLLGNLYYIYDPLGASLTGALTVPNMTNPAEFVCSAIGAASGVSSPAAATSLCKQTVGPLLNLLEINYVPGSVNPLQRPGAPTETSTGTQSGTQQPSGTTSSTPKSLQQLLNGLGGL